MESLLASEILVAVMFLVTCGLLLLGFPVALTLAGSGLIFAVVAIAAGIMDFSLLSAFPQRIFTIMTSEVLVAVPLFVFMGVMLERSKIAEELLDNMGKLFGPLRGGIGYSVCVVGALLAASTGIVGASVVTMGLLSLPVMLRRGYSPSLACGSICASGTLGQIIPPSIVLVLLGDQLSVAYQDAQFRMGNFAPDTVSVNDLFAGALIPGLALVGMYIAYQIIIAIFRPNASPAIPPEDLGLEDKVGFVKHLLHSLLPPIILIVAVLGSILGGLASPTEAAGVGAAGAIMLAGYRLDEARGKMIALGGLCVVLILIMTGLFDLRMQRTEISTFDWIIIAIAWLLALGILVGLLVALWRVYQVRVENGNRIISEVMRSTMEVSAMVFIILAGAGMFSLTFRGLGGDDIIHEILSNLPGGALTAMLLVMVVMFLLGFFLDFLEIVFIVVPIVSPALLMLEIEPGVAMSPVWLGVMMAINLQTSFLTPPFGFALFYLRGVAPESIRTADIYRGVVPFVGIQLLALVLLWFYPGLATWLPKVIFGS